MHNLGIRLYPLDKDIRWSPLLTQRELSDVLVGTTILVTWPGGNGPHEYILGRDEFGREYTEVPYTSVGRDKFKYYNPLHDVGLKRGMTMVQMLVTNCSYFQCNTEHESDNCQCDCHLPQPEPTYVIKTNRVI